jgi:hypothetical protein
MQNSRHALLALVVVLANSLTGLAQETPRRTEYKTPQAVFAAYKEATNEHDWKTLFSLGTTAYQNACLQEFAIGAAYSEEDPEHPDEIRSYRAIVAKHGIDWRKVRKLVEEARAGGDQNALSDPLKRMVDRVEKKAELFAAVSEFLSKCSDPVAVTVQDLKNLVEDGETATGDSIETRVVIETSTDQLTKRTSKLRRKGQSSSRLFFRRIDGSWHLDVEI